MIFMLHGAIIGFLIIFMTLAAHFCFIVIDGVYKSSRSTSMVCSSTFSSGYSSDAVHDAEDDTADDTEECSSTFSSGYSSDAVPDSEDDTAEFSSIILTSFLILVTRLPPLLPSNKK